MVTPLLLLLTLGYWAEDHVGLNSQVVEKGEPFSFQRSGQQITNVNDYLSRVLYVSGGLRAKARGVPFKNDDDTKGTDRPSDSPTTELELREWNKQGGLWEDGFGDMKEATAWGGLRAVNHFHDPLAFEGGYTGIKTETGFTARWRKDKSGKPVLDLFRPGVSVTWWAQGGKSSERNDWGYPTVVAGLLDFCTEPLQEARQRGLAAAFRSLGQLQHLVADNTVPDHARDLAHPGNGFEEWLRENEPTLFANTPLPWPRLPLERIERAGFGGFWDQDVYSGSSPADGLAEGAGIDEFTQANFLAWNRFQPPNWIHLPFLVTSPFAAALERDIVYFTTVPETTGVGFGHMPWPQLTGSSGEFFGAAEPGLPFSPCIAKRDGSRNIISPECWRAYALPLMKRAHGTALAVLTLALPPLRAELVPEPGDLTRFRVRLWNLGNARPGDSVPLKLDKISFTSVRFQGESMGTVVVEEPRGTPLAPGASPWVSLPFSLSLKEQGILKLSTYAAVVVEAHIGAGDRETKVGLSLPIPNGFPVVNQLTATTVINARTRATNVQSGCCNTSCTQCGENAEYVQPELQEVTGVIKRHSSHLDTFGKPATGSTRAAIDADTRIAGVALMGWGAVGGRWDNPIRPVRSTLTLTSGLFEKRGDMWIRKESAPDQADPERLDFSISLDARDFYGSSGGAVTALQTVHLVVWMTSGAVYQQSLALWPMRRQESAAEALASHECDEVNAPRNLQYEVAGGCRSTQFGEMPNCFMGNFVSTVRTVLFGPLRGLGTGDVAWFSLYPTLKITELGGNQVSSMSASCVPPALPPSMSYSIRCFSDFNSFIVENVAMTGGGACPNIPPKPPTPRTATMLPEWPPALKTALSELLGRTDEPAFQSVQLR